MIVVEVVPEVEVAESFGLDRLIRDVIEETDLVDPRDVARVVSHRIPASEVRDVLEGLLHKQVRNVLQRTRNAIMAAPREPKRQGGRTRWDNASTLLGSRVCVEGEWKLLGECSPKDVADLLFEYKERARTLIERASAFKRLLDVMQQARVATVAELGEETVKAIFDA